MMALRSFATLSLLVAVPGLLAQMTQSKSAPAATETNGPVVPSYSHAAPTTSLWGYFNATATTASAYPTSTGSSNSSGTLPVCKSIQFAFPSGTGGNATRAAAVKEAYVYAWDAYVKYAFPHDELLPLTKTYTDNWSGWGVTVVDGIDTAIVMNLTDVVAQQLAHIAAIDFTTTPDGLVEIFDTNIRYVGGLLSAYDMLKSGQFPNSSYDASQIDALLSQAVSLANKLAYGFNTPSGIAASDLNFTANAAVPGTYTVSATDATYNSTNTASAGTFLLEWYRLADLTGNVTYRRLVDRGESYLVNPSPAPVYPGLVGAYFDTDTGAMLSFDGGWHSEVDSFLEYLIKTYYYQSGGSGGAADATTTEYKDFWLTATQSTLEYLALHPCGFPDLTFISELDVNGTVTGSQDDYSCFAGGNWLLGCKALGMPALCDLGVAAADGCHQTYNQSVTGLGPGYWGWYNATNQQYDAARDVDAAARGWARRHGYYIGDGDEAWALYPESIESWFYAYRITGEARWAEYVWEVFLAINETARNGVAFATVNNVNMPFGGSQGNELDSFFFAEVLKYIYLTFEDPSIVSLDRWVFNTESHPMLVQCRDGGGN